MLLLIYFIDTHNSIIDIMRNAVDNGVVGDVNNVDAHNIL